MSEPPVKPEKLTLEQLEALIDQDPKSVEQVVRQHPAFQEVEDQNELLSKGIGDTQAALHIEKQKSAYFQNENADFYDIFKAGNRYTVSWRQGLFGFVDGFYMKAMKIDNGYRILHKTKWPPFYIVAPLIILSVMMAAILAYPPYAYGLGSWFSASSGAVPNAYVFLLTIAAILVALWLMVRRRSAKQQ